MRGSMQETWRAVRGADGVGLAVRSFEPPSADARAVVLHHGLASSQRIWDLMLPRLTRRFHVVTFDARGHGKSAKPANGYGFDHVVGDLRAVIRAERLRQPVVVGHSWGSMVALEAAARHPRELAGAVLVDGGLTPLRSSGETWGQTKERLAPPMLAGMQIEEFRGVVRTVFADALELTPDVEAIALSLMYVRRDGTIRPRLSRANHFRILRSIWDEDPAALIPNLRIPVLAVVAHGSGGDDRAKRAAASAARRLAPGGLVRVTWLRGIHDLPLHRPAALAGLIERFAEKTVG
jgi:pimeloyl-ACP methyl ester carboxylesterase